MKILLQYLVFISVSELNDFAILPHQYVRKSSNRFALNINLLTHLIYRKTKKIFYIILRRITFSINQLITMKNNKH